eukprot:CAMPEP_0202459622 /NCGR_PEP_ID=MMETSP1360-20130828/37118_1 /ASSEMBLY_ACC=CAM_ASM_000848 /TAXON_ID=515479 /ORGANISM="Licmophora paradoxa, Strain CCMP2313" /LENGTH=41 /DNA_ID= /DNA_START= /DNA_END= /DNA_ORIENTATION=
MFFWQTEACYTVFQAYADIDTIVVGSGVGKDVEVGDVVVAV